ncbi:MAG TPA: secondary thiamine-phosphate synthase enzyme YjbQ [Blastocatellia bacterium]|jgi:secondary thiamine-phosphate synthase enzyme|nr:secondary thiamine-phosphate synthase enzyme YjbQ [Blastocatellia bacterium]
MEAMKSPGKGAAALDCYTNQGIVKVFSKTMMVKTSERSELINLSDDIKAFVDATGVADGYVQVSSLHTTAGLFVNEWQDALLTDMKSMIEQIVPRDTYYRHNDPEFSDCDRHNADSHLRNVVVGHSLSVPIAQGKPVLGQWQSVILAEFDGPNERKVFMQVFGV